MGCYVKIRLRCEGLRFAQKISASERSRKAAQPNSNKTCTRTTCRIRSCCIFLSSHTKSDTVQRSDFALDVDIFDEVMCAKRAEDTLSVVSLYMQYSSISRYCCALLVNNGALCSLLQKDRMLPVCMDAILFIYFGDYWLLLLQSSISISNQYLFLICLIG